MKTLRFNSILTSGLLTCALALGTFASTPPAVAQESSPVKATIPFAFQIGCDRLPAILPQLPRTNTPPVSANSASK